MSRERPRITLDTVLEANPALELPRDRRGRIRWGDLRENPARAQEVIEGVVGSYLSLGGELSPAALLRTPGMTGVARAITDTYPDSYFGLRSRFGLPSKQRPHSHWKKPEAFEQLRQEAKAFLETEGKLTGTLLRKRGRADLDVAITRNYPGGLTALKGDLKAETTRKPYGYWTPEQIEKEARDFFKVHGVLTHKTLKQEGRSDLAGAILERFPGGMNKLKNEVGIEKKDKPYGYWTPERIVSTALEVLQQEGKFGWGVLAKINNQGLRTAIGKSYPGKMRQLLIDLKVESAKVPRVDPKTGTYTDSEGESWIVFSSLHIKYGLGNSTLRRLLVSVPNLEGRTKSGGKSILVNEKEAEKAIADFLLRPKVERDSGQYVDEEGAVWMTLGGLASQLKIAGSTLNRLAKEIKTLEGRGRLNQVRTLYSLEDAQEAIRLQHRQRAEAANAISQEAAELDLEGLLEE